MTSLVDRRRVEQQMIYVRWAAVALGALAVTTGPPYPTPALEQAARLVVGLLALANLGIWGFTGHLTTDAQRARLGAAAILLDAAALMAFTWVSAHERPFVTWGLLLLVPIEAALRYRLRGAAGGSLAVAWFIFPLGLYRADLVTGGFDLATYAFIAGLLGLVAGITGSMADNWHRQMAAFRDQSRQLAEVDRLKDRFLAVTSHEIRGPLAAIITGVDTVWRRADRLSEEQRRSLLQMVSAQGHQLARLVDDLMVTTHLQAGKLTLHLEWAELEWVVNQSLEAAAGKRRGHRLEVFVEPLRCEIDASRLGQVIRNLVENSYKYTPEKTRVVLTAKSTERGVAIEISDHGHGIPPDKREALFEAFSRIEQTSTGQEGVGLGLFVVSQIVAAMEGHIDLASSSRGTTFTISIPCSKAELSPTRLGLVSSNEPAHKPVG